MTEQRGDYAMTGMRVCAHSQAHIKYYNAYMTVCARVCVAPVTCKSLTRLSQCGTKPNNYTQVT